MPTSSGGGRRALGPRVGEADGEGVGPGLLPLELVLGDGELGVRASFDKRYITLAPVAGVVTVSARNLAREFS